MKKIFFFCLALLGFLSAAVNINTASIEELQSVKGIGKTKAEAIVAYRQDQNFTTIEDLKKVKGIGNKLFEQIKTELVVE